MFDHNIGKHCTLDTCKQKDWLPVKCKYCSKVYCADHSSIETHNCPAYEKQYKKVYICPLCNKTVNINQNLTVEQNFSIHEALDCKQDYVQNLPDHPICGGLKCRIKLTELNSYQCQKCRHKVCLKHRMPEDHKCLTVK